MYVAILQLQRVRRTCMSSVTSIVQCLASVAVSRMSRSVRQRGGMLVWLCLRSRRNPAYHVTYER